MTKHHVEKGQTRFKTGLLHGNKDKSAKKRADGGRKLGWRNNRLHDEGHKGAERQTEVKKRQFHILHIL